LGLRKLNIFDVANKYNPRQLILNKTRICYSIQRTMFNMQTSVFQTSLISIFEYVCIHCKTNPNHNFKRKHTKYTIKNYSMCTVL